MSLPTVPESALRLFSGCDGEELMAGAAARSLLCERLLEDGDSSDLRWLARELGEESLAAWFGAHGGRRLSARSRAFWALVLGRESGPASPVRSQLWPL
jgi:hypothetical protein